MPSVPVRISAAPSPDAVPIGASGAEVDRAAVQQAISASIAPLLRKQAELEVRLEREAAERQRLHDEIERLRRVTTSSSAPVTVEALPEMLDGARRQRRILVMILLAVAALLIGTVGAALFSHTR